MTEVQFPQYAAPQAKHLMSLIKKAMKGKLLGKVKKMPRMRKLLADPPGCRLHIAQDVKITPRKQ